MTPDSNEQSKHSGESSHDSLSDEKASEDNIPQNKVNSSPQLSCCSSDLSEFENLKLIEKQVFMSGNKEIVPDYLKGDHPPIEGKPCRDYLSKQTKWGERPPAEAFMKIANQLYIDHCLKKEKKMAQKLRALSMSKTVKSKGHFSRRHKSTGSTHAATLKGIIQGQKDSPSQRKNNNFMNSGTSIGNHDRKNNEINMQFFGKSANLVNIKLHQDENIFSDDVSKTFMDNIDEVPDDEHQSPFFPARRARSICMSSKNQIRFNKKNGTNKG